MPTETTLRRIRRSFADLLPRIEKLRITVYQDVYGQYLARRKRRIYSKDDPPPTSIPCANPRCQHGGLDLSAYILVALSAGRLNKTFEYRCHGRDGSPKGRHQGAPCRNAMKVAIRIQCARLAWKAKPGAEPPAQSPLNVSAK
jgi:hypothetical protein